jgi:hypothetical protein
MTKRVKRMTEMIRVYPETAELIRQIMKRSGAKTQVADVVEAWAASVEPEAYKVVRQTAQTLDKVATLVKRREDEDETA